MELPTETLGDRIRLLARRAGSQRALARQLDVSDATIIGWIGGSLPYRRNLEKIAEKCHVDLEWLLTGNGEPPPEEMGSSRSEPGSEPADIVEEMHTQYGSPAVSPDLVSVIAEGMNIPQIAATIQRIMTSPSLPSDQRTKAAKLFTEVMRQRLHEHERAAERRN